MTNFNTDVISLPMFYSLLTTGLPSGYIIRMAISLSMILILGAGAYITVKFLKPKLNSNLKSKRIKLIETLHIDSRNSISLLTIDSKEIVIAKAPSGITFLNLSPDNSSGDIADTKDVL
ncbi:MAG: flagellar biosynthetic protein FliO [Deltaproteobacteria bacterium]|nr:flagellar biosynthetic protein FliO [Deltaproteobacteria bacterium]